MEFTTGELRSLIRLVRREHRKESRREGHPKEGGRDVQAWKVVQLNQLAEKLERKLLND